MLRGADLTTAAQPLRHRERMPAADRYGLADVSAESRDGWISFARRHGTNRTALAEVLGVELARLNVDTDDLPAFLRRCVEKAIDLEEERRGRSR